MSRWKLLTLAALLIAVGIVASILLHSIGLGGQVILPLHYPAFLAGILLGGYWGMLVGVVSPLLSTLLTGMPPLLPSSLLMVPELAVYGFSAGLLRKPLGLIPALLAAMILGRLAWGLGAWMLAPLFGFHLSVLTSITAGVVTGLPGIAVQLILVPVIARRVEILQGHTRSRVD